MSASGPIVVDLQALQSPTSRGRGIGRYALSWASALEALRPDLVGKYLLNPSLNPPGGLDGLAAEKISYDDGSDLSEHQLLHVLSPLDTSAEVRADLAIRAWRDGLAVSATVYDLIPAVNIDQELIDPMERRRYRTQLELVRAADQIQVLSNFVGSQLVTLLHIGASRVEHVGAAPSGWFGPPSSKDQARTTLGNFAPSLAVFLPFVLYPSGHHPRKNNEMLVRAWAALCSHLPVEMQLVITGDFPESTRHHLLMLADSEGVAGKVVITGQVEDEVLLVLYQAAELVCFPSLAEGFALPVAEALACQTPVIATDRPPLDELLDKVSRFDPTSPQLIADAIEVALSDLDAQKKSSYARSADTS